MCLLEYRRALTFSRLERSYLVSVYHSKNWRTIQLKILRMFSTTYQQQQRKRKKACSKLAAKAKYGVLKSTSSRSLSNYFSLPSPATCSSDTRISTAIRRRYHFLPQRKLTPSRSMASSEIRGTRLFTGPAATTRDQTTCFTTLSCSRIYQTTDRKLGAKLTATLALSQQWLHSPDTVILRLPKRQHLRRYTSYEQFQ